MDRLRYHRQRSRDVGRVLDLGGPDEWSHTLTAAEVAEIDAALDHVEASGVPMADLDRTTPLEALAFLAELRRLLP